MSTPSINAEDRDGIAVLTMQHGKANAFDVELIRGLRVALDYARTASAVVLTGQGSIFSAGVDLKRLLDKTQFSMAHQDVRYYLNGLLIEASKGELRAVATDGHRLALAEMKTDVDGDISVIVPRKGVMELSRLLHGDGEVSVAIGSNHIQVDLGEIRFTSKLIDGRFPDYERVIPGAGEDVSADRGSLREALQP